jgi:UPF0271 protein
MELSEDELSAAVVYQLGALDACCRAAGTRLSYVKPHGALYHEVMGNAAAARAFIAAVVQVAPLAVLGPMGSELLGAARKAGLRTAAEVFADRGYLSDGRLVPRGEPGAVVDDPDAVAARVVQMATLHTVTAVDGTSVPVQVDSICLHSDTPGAVRLARRVREELLAAGAELGAFA